ncbi:Hypothetical protein GbCGDNIH4_7226 [Granulibacter bethesdensis CGDNIH4]|nr:Hypothetical protein GbCGDNIH4_7226 [Granulibacter bethesdensis CGDNIH4]
MRGIKMKKHFLIFSILTLSALTGCAALPDSSISYVSEKITNPSDASVMAYDAADYLTTVLPPAQTILLLDPPQSLHGNILTPTFETALRARGYALMQLPRYPSPVSKQPLGTQLRYLISPLDGGVLLQLQYQGVEAARFYYRDKNGALTFNAPFTVRESH